MKSFIKFIAIAFGGLMLVMGVGVILLHLLIDASLVKSLAIQLTKEHTGRELQFKGDVGFTIFPWLGVDLGSVALSNAKGFGDQPMAEIREATAKVKLLPLLSGDVEIGDVLIDGLQLHLMRNAKGATNFDDLKSLKQEPAKESTSPQPSSDEGFGISSVALGGIDIRDASFHWDDQLENSQMTLSGATLITDKIIPGQPISFMMAAKSQASKPALDAEFKLTATADPLPADNKPSLKGLSLSVVAKGEGLPDQRVEATIQGNIVIDLNAKAISLTGLNIKALDMEAKGDVLISHFDTEPVIKTTLNCPEFNPRKPLRYFGLDSYESTDPKVLHKASLSLEATATQSSANVKGLMLTLDDTTMSGSAQIKDFTKPVVRFNLTADTLDLDRYLPRKKDAEEPTGEPAPTTPKSSETSNQQNKMLKTMDIDGRLKVGQLTAYKVQAKDVDVRINAKNGVIKISPLAAGVYGGAIKSTLVTDLRTTPAQTKLDLKVSEMQLGGLLTALTNKEWVTGNTGFNLAVESTGSDYKSMLRTLMGKGDFALKDGVIKGFQVVPDKVRQQAQKSAPAAQKEVFEKEQPYEDIASSFTIKDGLLSSKDTKLSAKGMSGTGEGNLNLADMTIDYRAEVDLTALPIIPFTIKGPVTNPTTSLDTAAFLQGMASGIVNAPANVGQGALDAGEEVLKGIGRGLGILH